MNKKAWGPKRPFQPFFYRNKLYEFSQKQLSPEDRDFMKQGLEQNAKAKQELASVLMALEGLEKLSGGLQIEASAEDLLKSSSKRNKRVHFVLGGVLFILLVGTLLSLTYV